MTASEAAPAPKAPKTPKAPDAPQSSEADRLAALAAYAVIGADRDDPTIADLTGLCELAASVAGVPTAVVNLIDAEQQHQVAAFGLSPTPCRRDDAMCQTTLAGGTDVYLSDASSDSRYAASPWVDGRLARIRFYASVILRSPAGHPIGTLCVFDEATHELGDAQQRTLRLLAGHVVNSLELRLRTRLLERSNLELTKSQDRLASFAGQISHDLKAPITAIIGFTELLADMDTITDDPSADAYVGRCSSAARRMLGMIDDLLGYARVGGTLSPAPIHLADLVAEIVSDLGATAADATITAEGADVLADRGQFRALLQNLIGNALLYRGDRPCEVRVRSESDGDVTVVRVIDNGGGIPADSREEVLRPLVRVRKDIPGAGLGLAVCVRVVAAHGGSLRLDETPGGGTTAVITLPPELPA